MVMLRAEKQKHPNDVPDEILAIALPDLVRLAETAQSPDVAANAKRLAIDLSANTSIGASVRQSVEKSPARIYFHIRDETQRQQAADDAQRAQARLGEDFVVPGIQRVAAGPARTELRYFRQQDKDEASRVGAALKDAGVGDVLVSYTGGYEDSTGIRPRHYELWYGPPVGRQQ